MHFNVIHVLSSTTEIFSTTLVYVWCTTIFQIYYNLLWALSKLKNFMEHFNAALRHLWSYAVFCLILFLILFSHCLYSSRKWALQHYWNCSQLHTHLLDLGPSPTWRHQWCHQGVQDQCHRRRDRKPTSIHHKSWHKRTCCGTSSSLLHLPLHCSGLHHWGGAIHCHHHRTNWWSW